MTAGTGPRPDPGSTRTPTDTGSPREATIHGDGTVEVDGARIGRVERHRDDQWLAVAGGWSDGWFRTRHAAADALVRKFSGQGLRS